MTSPKTKKRSLVCVSVYIADPIYPKHVKRIQKGTRRDGWIVRVVCHEHQVFDWIVQSLLTQPSLSQYALIRTALVDATDVYRIYIELAEDYIPRSSRLNMTWYRRIWTLATRAHLISFTGVYYSVLGGAFCSLGKDNRQYAYKASILAMEQIKLAQRLKDPLLECKCWLYFAEDLIQLGRLERADSIIQQQKVFISSMHDLTLTSMLNAVQEKLKRENNNK